MTILITASIRSNPQRWLLVAALMAACTAPPSGEHGVDAGADGASGALDAAASLDASSAGGDDAAALDAAAEDAGEDVRAPHRCLSAGAPESPFTTISDCAGLELLHGADGRYPVTGQAWGDYDDDGWVDLFVTSTEGPSALYRNLGDGTFRDVAEEVGADLPEHASGGAVFADYDNDGWSDLYVLGLRDNVLLHNEGGRFVDVTATAGVEALGMGETASFGDYDGDGLLDLYVVNHTCVEAYCWEQGATQPRDHLFHNEGAGSFRDVSAALGLAHLGGAGFASRFLDYDGDGDADLYVVNDKGSPGPPPESGPINRNVLFRNDGPGCGEHCFTEVAVALGADARVDGMGVAAGDFDADGDLDLFMSHGLAVVLLENAGEAGFADVASDVGVRYGADPVSATWGAAFLDVDNDGHLDLYIGAEHEGLEYADNPLFMADGHGGFDVVRGAATDEPIGFTIGVQACDYDRDGAVDLVLGNYWWGYVLLRNVEAGRSGHHWISLRLEGAPPINRDAIGARVFLEDDQGRVQMRDVASGSSLGGNHDLAAHFGLGTRRAERARIVWPDGTEQVLERPEVDREHRVLYAR